MLINILKFIVSQLLTSHVLALVVEQF